MVARRPIYTLPKLVIDAHRGLHLCITAFDGGTIHASEEEIAVGWTMQGEIMVSPPIDAGLEVPQDQHDEWYILPSPKFDGWEGEQFVDYGGFTLADIDELYRSFDPSWEKHGLDSLYPIQERFWNQLNRVSPTTYVAMGDNDVVVSRNHAFIDRVLEAARNGDEFPS